MKVTIKVEVPDNIESCFECPFSKREYCWAACPFTKTIREDGKRIPAACPLKERNKNKVYHFIGWRENIYDKDYFSEDDK